jgi:hypothetical protein
METTDGSVGAFEAEVGTGSTEGLIMTELMLHLEVTCRGFEVGGITGWRGTVGLFTYTYTYTDTYTYTYTYTYTCTYAYTYTCTCTYTYACSTYTHRYKHTHTHTLIHVHVRINIHIHHIHINIHIHIHHIHIHIHIHIDKHLTTFLKVANGYQVANVRLYSVGCHSSGVMFFQVRRLGDVQGTVRRGRQVVI